MKELKLANSPMKALVSDEDYDRVKGIRWVVRKDGYIVAEYERTTLHRFILDFPEAIIDHIDRNTLNNQRTNLREVTKSQNAINSPGHKDRKTKYKGVYYVANCGRWRAQIQKDYIFYGKNFATEQEALAYRLKLEKEHFGDIIN